MVAGSPVRHEPPMQGNPVEVQSYQTPWKALSDFAMQGDMDQPHAPFQQLVSHNPPFPPADTEGRAYPYRDVFGLPVEMMPRPSPEPRLPLQTHAYNSHSRLYSQHEGAGHEHDQVPPPPLGLAGRGGGFLSHHSLDLGMLTPPRRRVSGVEEAELEEGAEPGVMLGMEEEDDNVVYLEEL